MKQTIIILFLCLAAITVAAQSKADIEVSYTEISPNLRTGKTGDSTHQYVLLANSKQSKFYSPRTEQLDSINSTPDGEARFKEMQRAAVLGGNYDDIPRRDGSMYVVKSTESNIMKVYDSAGTEQYVVEGPIETIEWTLAEDSMKKCLATTVSWQPRIIMAVNGPHGSLLNYQSRQARGSLRDYPDLFWRPMPTMAYIHLSQPAFRIPAALLSRYIWRTDTRKQPAKAS